MIQDASIIRDGVPDSYKAYYRIEVLAVTGPWNLNKDRVPSGFNGAGAVAGGFDVRTGVGLGAITFPAGFKVRCAKAGYSSPAAVNAANQRQVFVSDIDEAAGTAALVVTTAAGVISDPLAPTALPAPNDSWIWVELTLETV